MEAEIQKKPLVILAGPTAAGKTAYSVELAKAVGGSVISADSMQIYKYMDIGSAKITPEEMQGIPHYLVDELLPSEEFHIVRFQQMARAALNDIYGKGRIPIVAGGTGFYIQALLYGIDFENQDSDSRLRMRLSDYVREHGARALHERLAAVDPASAESIHENNVKRVIRALEFYEKTGTRISEHNERERQRSSPYNFVYFVLTDERSHLYERINERVDLMMKRGLLDEVKRLKQMGCTRGMVAMQGLGYKELLEYLEGRCTLEEAVYVIKRETRHFAKRQITWFKRERDVVWLDQAVYGYDRERILCDMLRILRERGICNESDIAGELS